LWRISRKLTVVVPKLAGMKARKSALETGPKS
jgi:hypothetical protein